jgi:hypothetical protein
MPTVEYLKQNIDCHDLADKFGWRRPGGKGNYSSPNRDDKTPSVSISSDGRFFKDYTGAENGKGSCIDMVLYHHQIDDVGEAIKILHDIHGWEMDKPDQQNKTEKREQTIAEFIAYKCKEQADLAVEYLTGRGISEDVVRHAIKKGTIGFNTYSNPKHPPGELFHGGHGVAFVTKSIDTSMVVGVDVRYLDPDLNGGLKTMSHGDKDTVPWTSDLYRLKHCSTVYFFESAINALSFETAISGRFAAAVATKGTEPVKTIDLHFMRGKQAVICMDNDSTNDDGKCPGPEASWVLYERLTAMNVACQIVDQLEWKANEGNYNDVNDVLKEEGAARLKTWLEKFEQGAIAGLYGNGFEDRKNRLYLPPHDYSQYWRFKCREDFTSWVKEMKKNDDGGDDTPVIIDCAGFRIASMSRISIAGATSVMSGEEDVQANVLFSVSVQTPRHGHELVRRVFEDERLHNLTYWNKFGPIYLPQQFNRLINILERGAHLGSRDAVNFVGIAWKHGKLVVNEGQDCYFTEPNKQCPYHNLTFPSGPISDAKRVIEAYQSTFKQNAAMMVMAWALGGHLKAILGFWPHMIIQAEKGSGKSVLIKRIERTIAFNMFSGQSMQTEYRLLTTISHTSHPVGWEEISARGQKVIDSAVALLQESYQYTITRRGADLTEYLVSAPVLLAGEDVPVKSLLGKVVRTELAQKKGPMLPEELPRFPVRQWLEFITQHDRRQIQAIFKRALDYVKHHCRASMDDTGADRMRENYAAALTAWRLLCDFSGLNADHGNFKVDLIAEMNNHIAESSNERDPWIWIIETIFDEISAGKYAYPHKFLRNNSQGVPVDCLALRHSHIMSHIKTSISLKTMWDSLPVKSKGVLLKQLQQSGVIHNERVDITINNKRECHLIALDLEKLADYGIYVSRPDNIQTYNDSTLHAVPVSNNPTHAKT